MDNDLSTEKLDRSRSFYFPSLTVNDTVASAASSSITMRPTYPHTPPGGAGSESDTNPLEFSSYDLLDSSDDEHTGTAGSTVSIRSVSPDDTVSVGDTDEETESDSDGEDEVLEVPSFDQVMSQTSAISTGTLNDDVLDNSGLTARPDGSSAFSNLTSSTSLPSGHTKDLDFPDPLQIQEQNQDNTLRIRMETVESSQRLPNPFHVLYVHIPQAPYSVFTLDMFKSSGPEGEPTGKRQVIEKLHQALITNQRLADAEENRSRRLRVSNSSDLSSRKVELFDSSNGFEVDVETCTGIGEEPFQGATSCPVGLYMKEKSVVLPFADVAKDESFFKRWDLVVFQRPLLSMFPEWVLNLKKLLWQHNVALIELVDNLNIPLSEPLSNSFHVVDTRDVNNVRYTPNLKQFCELDSKQLSLHLVQLKSKPWSKPYSAKTMDPPSKGRSILSRLTCSKMEVDSIKSGLKHSLILLFMTFLCYWSVMSLSTSLTSFEVVDVQVTTTAPTGTPAVLKTTDLTTKPVDSALGLPLVKTYAPPDNTSSEFCAHRLGDTTVLLVPPKYYGSFRRAPKLYVKVSRSNHAETLPHQIKVVDGMRAIELAREDAWGLITIELWAHTKPKLNQTFEMDFGHQWPDFKALSTYVRDLSNKTVKGLNEVYETAETGLQLLQHEFRDLAIWESKVVRSKWNSLVKTSTAKYGATVKSLSRTERTVVDLIHQGSGMTRGLFRKAKRNGKGIVGRVTGRRVKQAPAGKLGKRHHGFI